MSTVCPTAIHFCLQEPLQQTVRQIHSAFDALLDIEEVQQEQAATLGLSAQAVAATQAFLEDTAREIMNAGESPSIDNFWMLLLRKPCSTVNA